MTSESVESPAAVGDVPEGSTRTTVWTRRGEINAPVFVPDATRGVVRGVATSLYAAQGVEATLVSTAHLASQPGASAVASLGGVHAFMGWDRPVISDSGGFQVFSLLGSNRSLAKVSDAGLEYRFSPKQKYRQLSPRSCIEAQVRLGADIIYALDYCTHPSAPDGEQDRSVELTLRWAAECRKRFDELVADLPAENRPLLFAVVQGGSSAERRKHCAEALAEIGFDGYGFGGYPINEGRLVDEVALVAELTPPGSVLHGLGIGTPENVVSAWRAGYDIFDCTLPTRNARRGVLYSQLDTSALDAPRFYRYARMEDERWVRNKGPVDPGCDCEPCTTVPAGYLAHLYRIEDPLAGILGSLHNLRFYVRLMNALRAERER
ncbi:tRNA-guanine transglycosylase [Microtetraspora sp. NBRC 13810]|uniref:tRNA-ribosyltransferase family protein n=1 Tax=Microtetraspora sp. NBRC 13810 TaxID=3030990 RepID=UPI0024A2D9CF|nr:tRNA guanosine(34) transglycosylase Tgt [Microtetraspora sp. NBRC 13810]GLW05876.1 tRNA-guanine transglycosylase [Microtetraspora sp. NBRC 13810]